jgi:hypothetical protein
MCDISGMVPSDDLLKLRKETLELFNQKFSKYLVSYAITTNLIQFADFVFS